MAHNVTIEQIEYLMLITAVVAIAARRFRVPYTEGLVVAGILLALLPFVQKPPLTKELLFSSILPPLIFEASLYIRWKELRPDLPLLVCLATVGLLFSAIVTAVGMHFLVDWQWSGAILFGALIAATDPVSVIAVFKQTGFRGRLRVLVEAESIFNDGTAAVAFGVALSVATQASWNAFDVVQTLLTMISGGLICGVAVAGGLLLLAGRTEDHLLEIALTTTAAYGSFLLAEQLHASGVLATMTAGIIIGNLRLREDAPEMSRVTVEAFWESFAFLVNSFVFVLIGIHEASRNFLGVLLPVAVGIVLVLLGRAAAVYPCCAVMGRIFPPVRRMHQHVMFWGGLRGALALALALGLPPTIPQRDEIITVTFAVVAFSVFVQGLTMPPVLRKTGEFPHPHHRHHL